jgi:hypothetical protein
MEKKKREVKRRAKRLYAEACLILRVIQPVLQGIGTRFGRGGQIRPFFPIWHLQSHATEECMRRISGEL